MMILIFCYLAILKVFVLDFDTSIKQHIEIINSILDKDLKRTENALVAHVTEVLKKYNH